MNAEVSFGQVVKTRRRAMGLTQEELAGRVGCASVTLRKIEYDDLRPSVQIAERLAMALNVPLEERIAFVLLARFERGQFMDPLSAPPGLEEIGIEDLSGHVIRGYALGERIGRGGFGAVYRAMQSRVGREVAVKIILPRYANHPEFIRRFEAEAQLVARLEHPHIVPLYDYWREPNVAYLIMRLLGGGNVRELLRNGPLQPDVTLRILEQIGSALAAAHHAGVIHRDLKPANVLLDVHHNAYLADFGIAKNLSNALPLEMQVDALAGTPEYISPEQIRSEFVSPQTDIYCLGVMMYELLTGTVPYHGPTPIETMHQQLTAPLPPLAANRPGLPKALDDVVKRATAKDPFERYESVETLITDFRRSIGVEWKVRVPNTTVHGIAPTVTLTAADNPYKGLRAFNEFDSADFFGREALTQQLLARLGEGGDLRRFLAVAGPSGSGKSSVVKAGLIPALRRGALPGSENWFIVELMPGSNPIEELETALLRVAVNPPSHLVEWLRRDKRGLLRAVNRCLPEDPAVELVIVIDQFEELFTLLQDEAVRAHLLVNLLGATLDEDSRMRMVITLRADFVDRPLNYVDFGELIRQRTEFVLPLTTDELERAILSPAQRIGLEMEPGVVAAIIHDLGDQPGTLPLLQYALTELFEKREASIVTKVAYESIGGVLGALGRRAEAVFSGLDSAGQNVSRQLFLRLITLGEGVDDTRRRVLRSELKSLAGLEGKNDLSGSSEIDLVLDAFGKARLLTFDRDPLTRGPTAEIAHEALIRAWKRLQGWLAASREDLRIQRRLMQAAREWSKAGCDQSFLASGARLARFEALEQESDLVLNNEELAYLNASVAERQRRRAERATQQKRILNLQSWIIRILAVSLLVAVGLSVYAFDRRNAAVTQTRIAFSRQLAVQALAEGQKPLGNDELAALLAVRSLSIQYDPVADAALVEAADKLPLRVFSGHSDSVKSVAISPDGKYLLTGSADTMVKLWEIATGREVRTFDGHTGEIIGVAFLPDGTSMFSGSADGTVKLWDIATGQEIYTLHSQVEELRSLSLSAEGRLLLTSGDRGPAQLWDASTGKEIRAFGGQGSVAALSPDGKYLIASAEGYAVKMLEVATGRELHTLLGHTDWFYSLAFSRDDKYALTGSIDNTAKLWDVATGKEIYTIRGHSSSIRSVAFSLDGKYILTGSGDRTARLWESATGMEVRSWRGHMHRVLSAVFSPDGRYVVTGSQDGTAKLWDFEAGEGRVLRGHTAEIYDTAFSPDGKYILTSSLDGTAKLWDFGTGRELRTFLGHSDQVGSVNFSPDARYALTGGEDGTARLWNLATGQGVRIFGGQYNSVYDAVFSPDGRYVLTGGQDTRARLWEAATGEEVRTFRGHDAEVLSVAFSADGKSILTASADGTARIWDVETARVVQTFSGHTDSVYGAALSPDGKYVLTGSADTTARLWDVSTGREVRTFNGHTNTVYGVAFSPDGKYTLTASADRTAKLWDIATGAEVRTLSGHTSAVWSAAFSPDGKYVLTGSFDHMARLWEVDYNDFVSAVCARLLRDFTDEERTQAHIPDQVPTCPRVNK